jgi:endonuclease YncB( thermonuclease family)
VTVQLRTAGFQPASDRSARATGDAFAQSSNVGRLEAGGPKVHLRRFILATLALFLTACGPQIGDLEPGEEARVVRTYNGDTLELDNGLRVFLAEIDAPRGEDDYAAQAQGELEAQALHREVLLAYGGTRRWAGRAREDGTTNEAAIAHVFVKSEGAGFGCSTNW